MGLVVFVAGQWVLKVYIEPIQEQKRIVGRVYHALQYYVELPHQAANHPYTGAGEWSKERASDHMTEEFVREAKEAFGKLSAELAANRLVVPSYGWLARWRLVRQETEIADAAARLLDLTVTFGDPKEDYGLTLKSSARIRGDLGLDIGPPWTP